MVTTLATTELTRLGVVIDYCLDHLPPSLRPNSDKRPMTVVEGAPGEPTSKRELIVIGNVRIEQGWAPMGGLRRDEGLIVDILAVVSGDGRTQKPTWIRRRCVDIGNDIAGVFRTQPHITLGGLASKTSLRPTGYFPGPAPTAERPFREGTLKCELKVDNIRF